MTDNSQGLIEFLKTPFPYFFLIASLLMSIMLLSDSDFIKSIYIKDTETQEIKEENFDIKYYPEGESKFTISYISPGGSDFNELDMVKSLTKGFAKLVAIPAVIATKLSINALQIDYPNLNPDTYELFAVIAFIYFNLNSWLLLAYAINRFHDIHLQYKPTPKPILGIFSK